MYVFTFKQISYEIDFKNVLKDFSFKIENILILTLLSASSQNGQTHSKQFVGNSVLGKSVFDHFVGLALKGLIKDSRLLYTPQHQKSSKTVHPDFRNPNASRNNGILALAVLFSRYIQKPVKHPR